MVKSDNPTRVADAYSHLKGEIRANRMPPGFQISEPELALSMGMSRTPVREALIRLEGEGLVELIPRRGVRVLPVSIEDMAEIYEILTALEPEAAAAVAARKPSVADLAPLSHATDAMEAALKRNDPAAWAEADDHFHRSLLDLHGNRRLCEFASHLFDQSARVRLITLRLRNTLALSTAEHRQILTHLRDGNAKAVETAFRQHRARAADDLLGILKQFQLP